MSAIGLFFCSWRSVGVSSAMGMPRALASARLRQGSSEHIDPIKEELGRCLVGHFPGKFVTNKRASGLEQRVDVLDAFVQRHYMV